MLVNEAKILLANGNGYCDCGEDARWDAMPQRITNLETERAKLRTMVQNGASHMELLQYLDNKS
jgi:hypothetical protein